MKKLEKKFTKYGDKFNQEKRQGNVAMYSRTSKGGDVSYEIIKVGRHKGYKLGKNFIEPSEIYPGSSLWGIQGWTSTDIKSATERYNKLLK